VKLHEVVPEALAGERLDRIVALLTGLSRREVDELLESGAVRVGGSTATARAARLRTGDEVEVDVPERREAAGLEPEPSISVEVVHAATEPVSHTPLLGCSSETGALQRSPRGGTPPKWPSASAVALAVGALLHFPLGVLDAFLDLLLDTVVDDVGSAGSGRQGGDGDGEGGGRGAQQTGTGGPVHRNSSDGGHRPVRCAHRRGACNEAFR
jgi:hypothetical protein